MVTQTPELKLANGYRIPQVGLGTWGREQRQDATIETEAAVTLALKEGYRLIDTAFVNENEQEIGRGIQQAIDQGFVKREEIFVVSKLWNTFHRSNKVEEAFKKSLSALNTQYLDLYLMHWPIAMVPDQGLWPKDGDRVKIDSDRSAEFLQTWKAMERLVDQKMVRSIGLSNINKEQLQQVLKEGTIRPAVVQVEVHPYYYDRELLDFCKKENIVVMAYSPLGGHEQHRNLLENSTVQQIAQKERLSPAQVLLLWNMSEGRVVIPKGSNQERIKENIQFLSRLQSMPQAEVKQITQLSQGKHIRTSDPRQIFNVDIY